MLMERGSERDKIQGQSEYAQPQLALPSLVLGGAGTNLFWVTAPTASSSSSSRCTIFVLPRPVHNYPGLR
jgi:hypothetical protein